MFFSTKEQFQILSSASISPNILMYMYIYSCAFIMALLRYLINGRRH